MALDARQPFCLTRLTKISDLAIQSCDFKMLALCFDCLNLMSVRMSIGLTL